VLRQPSKFRVRSGAREDLRISFSDGAPALAFQRSRDEGSTAARIARGNSPIDELDELVWEPNRDLLAHPVTVVRRYPEAVDQPREIELVFAPQDEGGYHVYAPDLPGLHTEGDTLDEATANAQEALALYVEGMREDGRSLDTGVIRRKFPVPA
jgi:predicted RNase H-like HicB family nuclease